jgi:hypothetical protein
MQINLSAEARNAVVDTITALVDAAQGSGNIELLSSSDAVLARLRFSSPCSPKGQNGTANFYDIKEDPAANATGTAVKARIVDASGGVVFTCDVSDTKGDAVIRLNSNRIVAGGPVRIREFVLVMPA